MEIGQLLFVFAIVALAKLIFRVAKRTTENLRLIGGLAADRNAAVGAVRNADRGIEQAPIRRSNSFLNSPLRPRTMGARIITFLPSCCSRTLLTICSFDWRLMGTAQLGQ